jgi:hypothetical protein
MAAALRQAVYLAGQHLLARAVLALMRMLASVAATFSTIILSSRMASQLPSACRLVGVLVAV